MCTCLSLSIIYGYVLVGFKNTHANMVTLPCKFVFPYLMITFLFTKCNNNNSGYFIEKDFVYGYEVEK